MNVYYSTDKIIGPHGDLVRAKRDKNGDIILYVDAIAFDYADQQQGLKAYLRCFKEWNEDDHPRDEDGKWTDAGGGDGGGESAPSGGGSGVEHLAGFAKAGNTVDGLTVTNNIPNTASISAGINDYTILKGVREVPMSAFQSGDTKPTFYSKTEKERTEKLAAAIKESGSIDPLIVVIEEHNLAEGPYILEGGHRYDALRLLGKQSLPALVVIDHDPKAEKPDASKPKRLR